MNEAFEHAGVNRRASIRHLLAAGGGFALAGVGIDTMIGGNIGVGVIETIVGGATAAFFGRFALGEAVDQGYVIGQAVVLSDRPVSIE